MYVGSGRSEMCIRDSYEGDTANIKWEQGTADSDYLNELAGKVKEILSK